MNVTEQLAAFVAGLQLKDIPPPVRDRTHLLVLDIVGNAVRGRHEADSTPALLAAAQALGLASGTARVFADAHGFSPTGAALINASLAHSLDFDDTHAMAILHPGAPIIPAALAAAEMCEASGEDVIAGIIAGYEVALRLSLALPAAAHYDAGFHPTATCGAFGATAAAARIFGLPSNAVASAFGVVLSQSAGSLQFLANGAWTKRFQVGWAAMSGLVAATLAREGYKGAAAAIEGQHGFLRSHAPDPRPERVLQDLGTAWELMETAVKPYPSCRWGHACIDAALALRAEHDFKIDEIESAVLGLPRAGMLLIGEPAARKADPKNVVDCQFSGPFVVAAALATGKMDWESYALLDDPIIRRLLPLIRCEHDMEVEAEAPANMSGKLTLKARGQSFTRMVIVPKGEPTQFPTVEELRAKFSGLVQPVLGDGQTTTLADMVLSLDKLKRVEPLLTASVPSRPL